MRGLRSGDRRAGGSPRLQIPGARRNVTAGRRGGARSRRAGFSAVGPKGVSIPGRPSKSERRRPEVLGSRAEAPAREI
jgi:hypothetical protein